jgi:DNA polymerase III epsilon subunit family exonuclease
MDHLSHKSRSFNIPVGTVKGSEKIDHLFTDGTFIVFDLETTGGNPEKNCILEISALKYVNGNVESSYYSLVNPRMAIPPIIRRITGITNQEVRHAPYIEKVFPEFMDFIGDDILVSHNAQGDLKFLVHFSAEVCHKELPNFFVCTHLLAQKLFADAQDKSLMGLARHLNLVHNTENQHRADEDARVTLELFKAIVAKLDEKGVRLIRDAVRMQGDMQSGVRLGPLFDAEELKNLHPTPAVMYLANAKGKNIFASSLVNLRRDLKALNYFDALPRKLLKIILDAQHLKITEHQHLFPAMYQEAEEVTRSSLQYLPYHWHGRNINALNLSKEGDGYRVFLGPFSPGLVSSYGPLSDFKKAQKKLDDLAELLSVNISRNRGLWVPEEKGEILVALFAGTLEKKLSRLRLDMFKPKNVFSIQNQKKLWDQAALIKKLMELKPLENFSFLFSINGVICVPHDRKANEWELYPVISSFPQAPQIVKGDWQKWLSHSEEGGIFVKQLQQQIHDGSSLKLQDLQMGELLKINAVLWMQQHHQQRKDTEGLFLPLSSLTQV